jgi:hypothetical protein
MKTGRVVALAGLLLALVSLFFGWRGRSDPPGAGRAGASGRLPRAARVQPARLRVEVGARSTGRREQGSIEGIVVGPDGAGFAGASVALLPGRRGPGGPGLEAAPVVAFALSDDQLPLRWVVQGDPGWEVAPPIALVLSDGQGRFRFGGLGPAAYALTAVPGRRGLAPGRAEVAMAAGETRSVRLALAPGGFVVSGRVREARGGPVGGARVTAALTERDGDRAVPASSFGTTSAVDGAFSLSLLAGRYILRAEADGYAAVSEPAIVGADIERDLHLEPAGSVSGEVVSRGSGAPVAGARVQARLLEGWSLGRSRAVESDGAGQFRLESLSAGDFVVEARADRGAGRSAPLRVMPGQAHREVVVELADGLSVLGQVVDASGRPTGGVHLTAWSHDGQAPVEASSAADGRFRIDGLLPGSYELRAIGPEGARTRVPAKLVDRDLSGVELRLQAQVIVTGLVIDPSGRPVEGARVMAGTEPQVLGWAGRTAPATTTSADGRFRFQGIDAGRVTIRVEKEGVGATSWVEKRIPPGAVRELILRLEAAAGLTGLVRFEDGRPAPGAVVYVEYPESRRRFFDGHGREHVASRAVAGPDAIYAISGLDPGAVRVTASRAGGALRTRQVPTVSLTAGEQKSLDLVVPRAQSIAGQVRLPDGRPAAGALVLVDATGSPPPLAFARRGMADQDGHFAVGDLDAGQTYTVRAEQPGHAGARVPAVPAGTEALRLELGPAHQ